jgi:hypothetical protein
MRTPPVAGSATQPGSGGQPGTALTTAGADDGSARPGPHAQPEAVCSRPTAIVRLEGALHVRAPSSAGVGGERTDDRPGVRRRARRSGALVGPTHGTWPGRIGSNRTPRKTRTKLHTRVPPSQDPRGPPPRDGFLPRHAENAQSTCGHRLNPSRGVVTVPGSTSVVTAARLPGRRSRFRRSAGVCWAVTTAGWALHTLWMTVWTCSATVARRCHRRRPARGWRDERETV